ncbi:MAG: acetate--CoA ligase family protein [Rhodospirillaceae bacterium]|nr:acetate--CoA ligase family protein [Rhodospirillaceae bacterium]MBT5195697.1 acetate--CoA ligase family protein [Rhodospirillaceae bacterium]MBT5895282.1 acetate--CoA ligase family protein [Rhodospirillaceae bacterium]MBT6428694.1 acetate--CoA ligase family protein [Rhodospirillaceae bacterium]
MTSPNGSLAPLFDPKTVAIIGASDNILKFGGRPIRFMREGNYAGTVYPINPKGGMIQGLQAYKNIRDVPDTVDMCVVTVPAPLVVDAVKDCVAAGVRSVVIFSSGFSEVDEQGVQWQAELDAIARNSDIRLVGPNCMGVLNASSHAVGTFASSFEHGWPKTGPISIISQSGAVGGHIMVLSRERGIGIRNWITTGNEVDVDVADCIAYCADDPDTKVIASYMEGTKKPEKLMEAFATARANGKAIVMMKVGASDVGAVAANSHTASLAGADAIYDAMFRQYGVCRVYSMDEMLDVAAAAAAGHFPNRNRLGIVTISGGIGVLTSDIAALHDLEVPELPQKAQQALKELMPLAAVRNPVDTTAQMLNDMPVFEGSLRTMLTEGDCDAILIFLSTIGFSERMMAQIKEVLERVRADFPDDLMILSMVSRPPDREYLESLSYLVIEDPNRAIRAISALVGFGRSFVRDGVDELPLLPAETIAPPLRALSEVDAAEILGKAGLPMAPGRLVHSADDAAQAAMEVGYPVVMKIVSPDIQHKSDIGGVKLNLQSVDEVRAGYQAIMAAVGQHAKGASIDGVLVAPMISGGVETIIGVHRDPVFGPVVLFGLGGIFVEVLKDVTFRIAPFGLGEAHRMIDEVRGRALLDGVRGQPASDVDALALSLSQLSVYAALHGDVIESIDINPFLVKAKGEGVIAVDALILTHSE